ncbi:MAG: metallophosphoesterase [Lachnospiraceae bacterium]|nr:metallophosphoesterase [Lachnospiraceae bacterium]
MKIIHCADIHLDSPFTRLGDTEKKKERKAELIKAFKMMISHASKEDVRAVIIAGDLFDQSHVSATAKNAVLASVRENPDIDFFFLKGNHDKCDFPCETDDIPDNFHMFSGEWQTYDLGENVFITGIELNRDNAQGIYSKLNLDVTHFNIVTMHGQDAVTLRKDGAQTISIRDLKNKNIDYLALGHIHSYKEEKLDGRGTYCYPGCLESRGYDETGDHGFVVLDINGPERTYTAKKECNPIRESHVLPVDISGLVNSSEILLKTDLKLRENRFSSRDMVKVELIGQVDFECEKNPDFIEKQLEDRYYDFKLKDNTGYKVDYDDFRFDESLKGEFIRTVESQEEITEEDKAEIIRIGIKALLGEEIE